MPQDIPPGSAVDRDLEQEEFSTLLTLHDNARVLLIQDREGTGKTTLLRRLHYNCRYREKPAKPAGLVDLDNKEMISPFALIESMRNSLPKQLNFERFDKLNRARINKEAAAFSGSYRAVTQSFEGATFSGGQVNVTGVGISTQSVAQQTINVGAAPWSEAQEELARQECISAFYSDLKAITQEQLVVVLLDSIDKMPNKELEAWIQDELVFPLCLDVDNRPAQFVLVLAGRSLPGFNAMLKADPDTSEFIRSRPNLSSWSDEHVKEFLEVNGITGLKEDQMQMLVDYVKTGPPIKFALLMAEGFRYT